VLLLPESSMELLAGVVGKIVVVPNRGMREGFD
jgi:hypothetical protein